MKKKIISVLTAFSLMLATLFIPSDLLDISMKAGSAEAVQGCGGASDHKNMRSCTQIPTGDGSYYLTNNVTLKPQFGIAVKTIKIENNTTLCLNGKTITIVIDNTPSTTEKIFNILGTLTICDCTGNGQICIDATGASSDKDYVLFNINNGGIMNLCGGKILFKQSIGSDFYSCVSIAGGGFFNMYGGSISGFKVKRGAISNSGTFNLSGGSISDNTSSGNGGVYAASGGVYVASGGTFIMSGGSISGNTSSVDGGGVYVTGSSTFNMSDGTITGNNGNDGGGVYVDGSTFNMTGGTITGNTAKIQSGGGYGGGVYNNNSSCTISGGSITGNTANPCGGGIYHNSNVANGTLLKGNVDISGNTTTSGEASNVYVEKNTITVGSDFNPSSVIGISSNAVPADCAHPLAIITASDDVSANFKPEYSDTTLYLEYFSEEGVVKVETQHTSIVNDEAAAATCTTPGKTAGSHCTTCNAVIKAQETVAALGHKEQIIPGKAATCTETGLTAGKKCSVCDTIITAQTTIKASGHSWGSWTTKTSATCTGAGTQQRTCSKCSKIETRSIEKLGHNLTHTAAKAATCTAAGNIEYWYCSRCTKYFKNSACTTTTNQAGTVINAKGHTIVTDAAVAATCTTPGKTEGSHCSVCGNVLTAQETIPVKAHTWNSSYEHNASNHWKVCTVCHTEDTKSGHNWDGGTVKTAATEETEGEMLYKCTVCKETKTEVIPKLAHTHNWKTEWSSDDNYHWHACTKCDNHERDIAHKWDAGTVTDQPSCTQTGTRSFTCSDCGKTKTEAEPTAAHTEKVIPAVDPTCTETGLKAGKKCSVCGTFTVEQAIVDALGHDWNEGVVTTTPTCTDTGVKTFTCKRSGCGATRTETVAAKGHKEETIPAVAATCTKTGLAEGKKCTVCNTITVEQATVEALGHDWNEGVVTTAPTCTDTGVKTFTCKRGCGATQTETVAAKGHMEEAIPAVAATCTKTGLAEGKKCTVCDTVTVEQATVEALGHDWDEGVVTKEPTCTETGSKTVKCNRCGAESTEEVPANGHTEAIIPAVAATCTKTGLAEGKKCTVCNTVTVEQATVDALGHDWNEGVVTKEPTCTGIGTKTVKCNRCGAESTEEVPAKGHTEEAIPVVAATCTATGLTEGKRCSVCGTIFVEQTVTAMTEHSWDSGVVTTPPTETADGVKTYTCTACGATKTEQIPMGKITTEVKPEANVPQTEIKTSNEELIKAALNEGEQEIIKDGTNIKIILTVEDATNSVKPADKTKVEAEISVISHCKLGQYLDVKLLKIIGNSESLIAETNAPITVTFEIPDGLRGKKEYSVIRVHGSETTMLKDLDSDPKTITIETDKFSTYALVYVERTSSSSGGSSGGGSHYRPSESDTSSASSDSKPAESDSSASSDSKPTESDSSASSASKPIESDSSSSSDSKSTGSNTSAPSEGEKSDSEITGSSEDSADSTSSTSGGSSSSDENSTVSDTAASPDDNHSVPDESTPSGDTKNPATGIAVSLIPLTLTFAAVTTAMGKRKKK